MIKQSFTKEQAVRLLKNKHVLKLTGTYISYTPEFKIQAVTQYLNEGLRPKEIFTQAGFDLTVVNPNKPGYLLYEWLKIFKAKGATGFNTETRGSGKGGGRVKDIAQLTDPEKIKRLQLEVQYLKKENDFLVKLRAKRAE